MTNDPAAAAIDFIFVIFMFAAFFAFDFDYFMFFVTYVTIGGIAWLVVLSVFWCIRIIARMIVDLVRDSLYKPN